MQRVRFLLFIILISIGFLFNGEIYMLHQDNFQDSYYQADFYFDMAGDNESPKIIEEFEKTGKKFNINFFFIERKFKSALETEVKIYGTDKVKEELKKKGILSDRQSSLFFGDTNVIFLPFSDIEYMQTYRTCYFLGDESDLEQMRNFKAELVDKYGGGFPKKSGSDKGLWLNIFFVWGIICGLILLTTLVSCLYQRKENMVKIILGESVIEIFLKNSVRDTAFLMADFFVLPFILSFLTNTYFKYHAILVILAILLILNLLLNTMIFNINFKKNLAGAFSKSGILSSSYILKVISTILLCIIISSNIEIIRDGYNLYKQKDFFEEHKDYYYCQIAYRMEHKNDWEGDKDLKINHVFYRQFQNKSLQYNDLSDNFDAPYPVILLNQLSAEETKTKWKSIAEALRNTEDEKMYLLVPTDLPQNTEAYKWAKMIGSTFFEPSIFGDIETISYKPGIELTGIHCNDNYTMRLYKDPILLFHSGEFQIRENLAGYDGYYHYDTMFKINDKEWNLFISENNMENEIISKTNVQDVYFYNLTIAKRNIRMSVILSCILFFMEFGLISFILRTEYQLRAVEMALKKLHGYTLLNRNKSIILLTVISTCIGTAASIVLGRILGMGGGYIQILIGAFLLIIEVGCILRRVALLEKQMIGTILKGEII